MLVSTLYKAEKKDQLDKIMFASKHYLAREKSNFPENENNNKLQMILKVLNKIIKVNTN